MFGTAFCGQLLKLAQHFLLALSQFDWRFHYYMAEKIARVSGADTLDAFAAQTESFAGLRAFRNRERDLAPKRRHFDFPAQCRLGKGDRHLAMQVIAIALEYGMRLDMNFNIQIARRAAVHPWFAVT